jgi:hypothetical protein
VDGDEILVLLDRELNAVPADARRDALQAVLLPPFTRDLRQPHNGTSEQCWVVAADADGDLQIVFAPEGPSAWYRWGIARRSSDWAGTDGHWFATLDDAFINSGLWQGPLPDGYEVA